MHQWPFHQLDVKILFLNGMISETVFMEQPPGFVDEKYHLHVCRLKKALYGLKQSPRAWFQRLSTFLLALGFSCNHADTSLFVFKQLSTLLYVLIYVDDIILTENISSIICNFINQINKEFAT